MLNLGQVKPAEPLQQVQNFRFFIAKIGEGVHVTADVAQLLGVLQRLVDGGNTVLVIEHNMDVIKCADYIIDLGPEGGDGGGTLVAKGTPEQVAECERSYTGQYLRKTLQK
jgi:excinuclease ABC subunit A